MRHTLLLHWCDRPLVQWILLRFIKAGLHVRRKHKYKHKPRVNQDDASARSFFLRLRRPGSHVAYACACACVVRVNQPLAFIIPTANTTYLVLWTCSGCRDVLRRMCKKSAVRSICKDKTHAQHAFVWLKCKKTCGSCGKTVGWRQQVDWLGKGITQASSD